MKILTATNCGLNYFLYFYDMKQKRIEWICELLIHKLNTKKNGASFNEIQDYLKKKTNEIKSKTNSIGLSKRTIESDIKAIRIGDFDYSNKNIIKNKDEIVFHLKYNRNKDIYFFDYNYPIPEFNKNTEEENLTLPFIEGILAPYKELPGVKKVIEKIKEIYPIEFNLEENRTAVVTSNSYVNSEIKTKLANKTTELLKYIKSDSLLLFSYIKVNKQTREIEDKEDYTVLPIQVRIHEELYYLIAFDIKLKKITTFRIDQIKSKIDVLSKKINDELYNLKKNFNESFFEYSFGIIRPESDDVYTINIRFTEWAAQYVFYKPIHKTQKIITKTTEGGIEISIKLLLENEPKLPYDLENISKELAFALSRFRNYYSITSIVKDEFKIN